MLVGKKKAVLKTINSVLVSERQEYKDTTRKERLLYPLYLCILNEMFLLRSFFLFFSFRVSS